MYRYINPFGTAVVHTPTSRCIYAEDAPSEHSLAYAEWLSEGNTPDQYVAPPEVQVDRKAEIIAQIAALDLKRIRPMAEGDTIFLGRLTIQIKALRDELKALP